jgi:hypothetical protein
MKYVSKHSAIAVLILIATALTLGACDAGFLSDARENPNSP